jgi:lysophospholipid acyltransferase (LPLAT)-like uncharacterized protein
MGQKSVSISMNAEQAIIRAIWGHMTASIQTARSHVRQKLEVEPQKDDVVLVSYEIDGQMNAKMLMNVKLYIRCVLKAKPVRILLGAMSAIVRSIANLF